MDFPINLNSENSVPLWKQLCTELNNAIITGRLEPGASLPPTRQLAALLKVSRDTVVRAYDELSVAGSVETFIGVGTFVCQKGEQETFQPPAMMAIPPHQHILLSDYGKRLQEFELSQNDRDNFRQLNFGAIPPDELPVNQWRESLMMRNGRLEHEIAANQEVEPFGYRALREALAKHLRRSKAIKCHTDQVALFSEPHQAIDMIARLFLNPGDGVLIENPGSADVRERFLSYGATLCPVDVDDEGLLTSKLDQYSGKCKLAYVTPSHHNPSGVVMSQPRRLQLLSWARRNNVLVIEDAFDSDYRYGSQPMAALQGMDTVGCVIYLYSFWKTLYPITSLGCMVLPTGVMDVFAKAKTLLNGQYSLVEHHALANFLTCGHMERHLRKTWATFAKRRQSFIYSLALNFKSAVHCGKESAGLHLRARFSHDISEDQMLRAAAQADLPMVSTRQYYLTNPVQNEFLIPFASVAEPEEKIRLFCSLLRPAAAGTVDTVASASASASALDFSPSFADQDNVFSSNESLPSDSGDVTCTNHKLAETA